MSNPSGQYEYRFVAACGLERKYIGPSYGLNLAQANGVPPKLWDRVKGEDFLSMTWEELEHVAHVIRDASRPSEPPVPMGAA
jgi:hypothetical protein